MDLTQKVEDIIKEQNRSPFINNRLNQNNLSRDFYKTNERGTTVGECFDGYRRLTDVEIQDKHAKGLCYRCN